MSSALLFIPTLTDPTPPGAKRFILHQLLCGTLVAIGTGDYPLQTIFYIIYMRHKIYLLSLGLGHALIIYTCLKPSPSTQRLMHEF